MGNCQCIKPKNSVQRQKRFSKPSSFRYRWVAEKYDKNIWEDYEKIEKLGTGMTGSVWKAQNKENGQMFAVKSVEIGRLSPKQKENLQNEIRILKMMDHPNIIKLFSTYCEEQRIFLVMEFCSGGELYERLATKENYRYSERDASAMMRKMVSAVSYCHAHGITHRDLKLENFVFDRPGDDSEIKLIDFGLSRKYLGTLRMRTLCGSPYYISPEIFRNEGYTESCDMWGLGVITYMLLSGKPPFDGPSDAHVFQMVQKGKVTFDEESWKLISPDGIDFIQNLLEPKPDKRITAEDALQHPWIQNTIQNSLGPTDKPLDTNIINRLRRFKKYSLFKRFALEAMAFSLTNNNINIIKDVFQKIDRDHSGLITLKELHEVLVLSGVHSEEVERIFATMDTDSTNYISYIQFLAATIRKKTFLQRDRLRETFQRLDVDRTGYITTANLREVLGEAAAVEEIMKSANSQEDDKIDYEAFLRAMSQHANEIYDSDLVSEIEESSVGTFLDDLTSECAARSLADVIMLDDGGSVGSSHSQQIKFQSFRKGTANTNNGSPIIMSRFKANRRSMSMRHLTGRRTLTNESIFENDAFLDPESATDPHMADQAMGMYIGCDDQVYQIQKVPSHMSEESVQHYPIENGPSFTSDESEPQYQPHYEIPNQPSYVSEEDSIAQYL
eukprot:TRINITY_DN5140_c0_g1_i1.p1 TRINITY_DN5140_c0_g1~~TRINITY_DN5140_c0_g1_i1.p1  ORF type:complete len:671 (-),score=160.88 TRINITY_DN5140_c0_g1_i1:488-2500(-)